MGQLWGSAHVLSPRQMQGRQGMVGVRIAWPSPPFVPHHCLSVGAASPASDSGTQGGSECQLRQRRLRGSPQHRHNSRCLWSTLARSSRCAPASSSLQFGIPSQLPHQLPHHLGALLQTSSTACAITPWTLDPPIHGRASVHPPAACCTCGHTCSGPGLCMAARSAFATMRSSCAQGKSSTGCLGSVAPPEQRHGCAWVKVPELVNTLSAGSPGTHLWDVLRYAARISDPVPPSLVPLLWGQGWGREGLHLD